jgi:hypothetical protein
MDQTRMATKNVEKPEGRKKVEKTKWKAQRMTY